MPRRARTAAAATRQAAAAATTAAAVAGAAAAAQAAAAAASRRLRWNVRDGMENPCDKNDFFRGQHKHCYAAVTNFYAEDLLLLAQ